MAADSKIAAAAAKVPLFQLPLRWLKGVARVFAFGARKHGRANYFEGDTDPDTGDRYVGGILRHLSEMQTPGGQYTMESLAALDDESGLPHIDHLMCGVIMLRARMVKAGALTDDPGAGKSPPVFKVSTFTQGVQFPPFPVTPGVQCHGVDCKVCEVARTGKLSHE